MVAVNARPYGSRGNTSIAAADDAARGAERGLDSYLL
jgi:hypothetical protein